MSAIVQLIHILDHGPPGTGRVGRGRVEPLVNVVLGFSEDEKGYSALCMLLVYFKLRFTGCSSTSALLSRCALHCRDAQREKQRQATLAKRSEERALRKGSEHVRKEKQAGVAKEKMEKLTKKKRNAEQLAGDLEDLDKEYRLLKKLKKGKISEREYAQAMGDVEDVTDSVAVEAESSPEDEGLGEGDRKSPSGRANRRSSTNVSGKGPKTSHQVNRKQRQKTK